MNLIDKILKKAYLFKEKIKSQIRERKIRKKRKNYGFKRILEDIKKIGINKEDILFVHSSLSSIGYVKGGPKTIIEALLEVIGPEGTLIFPTYPMRGGVLNNCLRGGFVFDLKRDPAQTGAIPNEFLKVEGIHRSLHPTHSVSAIGKYAEEIVKDHHKTIKTYGANSPWGKVKKMNGKVLGIGISIAWSTQYHHLEDIMGDQFPVKVKVDETYKLKTKLDKDHCIEVEVQPNDPKIYKTRIEKNPFLLDYFTEIYNKLGILHTGKIGKADSWWFKLKEFIKILRKLANLGITIYSTENELKEKDLYPFEKIKEFL